MDIRSVNGGYTPPSPPVADPAPAAAKPAAPVELVDAVRQPAAVPRQGNIGAAVKDLNKSLQAVAPGVEFSIDEDSQRTVVKIVDQETKEVLRQVPTEEVLELAKALDKLQGLLIQQKA